MYDFCLFFSAKLLSTHQQRSLQGFVRVCQPSLYFPSQHSCAAFMCSILVIGGRFHHRQKISSSWCSASSLLHQPQLPSTTNLAKDNFTVKISRVNDFYCNVLWLVLYSNLGFNNNTDNIVCQY